MTLEQVFKFVEAKEAGKRSATHLLIPHGTDALTGSTYRSKKKDPLKEGQAPRHKEQGTKSQGETCSYCGRKGHGKNAPWRVWRKECPAYGAEPIAHHSPIPVLIHWQAGLERDVRLGVIEPVPIGEPVTWCHRMVICAKKNGKPRRPIDFQPLGRLTILNLPSTKPGRYPLTRRKLS